MKIAITIDNEPVVQKEMADTRPAELQSELKTHLTNQRRRACRRLRGALAAAAVAGVISTDYAVWIASDLDRGDE